MVEGYINGHIDPTTNRGVICYWFGYIKQELIHLYELTMNVSYPLLSICNEGD